MYSAHAVQAYLNERFDEIVDCRHHLHQYPEIGLELPQTAAYIESELKNTVSMRYIKTLAVQLFLR